VVIIPEVHLQRAVPDPAAQTEMEKTLKEIGCTVFESRSKLVRDWAQAFVRTGRGRVPAEADKADLVVVGEAFSEFANQFGQLYSSTARLEVKIIDRRTGAILASDSANTAAVDLSEHLAGKKALQKAARILAVELIPKAVKDWAPAQG
jgi:hypothetical protein